MSLNRVLAIVERHAAGRRRPRPPASGDVVWLRPDRLMTHDNTSAVMARFRSIGGERVAHPERCLVVLDHDIQNMSAANLEKYRAIEAFAREQGIEFHAAGSGIGHQLVVERGYAAPGDLVVAADSHANMYGGTGALGVALSRSDAAGVWVSGVFWWEIPPVIRVVLEGRLAPESTGKDVALALCALYHEEVLGRAVEIEGPGVAGLSADDRLTLANLTTEWGAGACVVSVEPAPGAESYEATITLSLDDVVPQVSGPDTLTIARPIGDVEAERIAVDKAYLVSCANGRLSDLESAAAVLRGQRVADGVELYVSAASAAVERAAIASGAWHALIEAGAIPLPSGCGPCIGLGTGLLAPGETGISASNRNFKGRMGSREARCYLASPAVVAASARAGTISAPSPTTSKRLTRSIVRHEARDAASGAAETAGPAVAPIAGRLVLFLRDGIDTDALCPARFVYVDATRREDLARAVFESIDPAIAALFREGDVLVAGARFGIGSSREQAVWALQAAGCRAVLAESIAPVFRRNAWNNGLPAIEGPRVVAALRSRFPRAAATAVVPGGAIAIDATAGLARFDDVREPVTPLPAVARELLAAGGLDGFLRAAAPIRS